jgi:hypothetical protein
MLTEKILKELLTYDAGTGVFKWINSPRNNVPANSVAGTYDKKGYLRIIYKNKLYLGHWLAWFFVYEKWPNNEIDHINGNPSDNRIKNLRDVTRKQNMENKKVYKNSKTGCSGVTWHKKKQRWVVRIGHFGKRISIGQFINIEDAINARVKAENKIYTHKPIKV